MGSLLMKKLAALSVTEMFPINRLYKQIACIHTAVILRFVDIIQLVLYPYLDILKANTINYRG